jgi:hypothetical protein
VHNLNPASLPFATWLVLETHGRSSTQLQKTTAHFLHSYTKAFIWINDIWQWVL